MPEVASSSATACSAWSVTSDISCSSSLSSALARFLAEWTLRFLAGAEVSSSIASATNISQGSQRETDESQHRRLPCSSEPGCHRRLWISVIVSFLGLKGELTTLATTWSTESSGGTLSEHARDDRHTLHLVPTLGDSTRGSADDHHLIELKRASAWVQCSELLSDLHGHNALRRSQLVLGVVIVAHVREYLRPPRWSTLDPSFHDSCLRVEGWSAIC